MMMKLFVLLFVLLLTHSAASQDRMVLERFTGVSRPIFLTSAPGDSSRLFIARQGSNNSDESQVLLFDASTGERSKDPFLTLTGVTCCNELGFLGLAFHPNYEKNGRVYVNFTSRVGGSLTTVVDEYTRLDNDTADPSSRRNIMTIDQPGDSHNAGWMSFGPDGYLYIAVGDGDVSPDSDNFNNSQTITNNLLGKILRIDPLGKNGGSGQYGIPASNPFVGVDGDDEIWAYGLRNPFRASFDRETGDLYIGDVGAASFEEVNIQPSSSMGGENYGWRVREGISGQGLPGAIDPAYFYAHGFGDFQGQAVIGGYVYRGPIAALKGHYFFADNRLNRIWSFRWTGEDPSANNGANITNLTDWTPSFIFESEETFRGISSFGEDSGGNLFVTSLLNNRVYRISDISIASIKPSTIVVLGGDATIDGVADVEVSDDVDLVVQPISPLKPFSVRFEGEGFEKKSVLEVVIESSANTVGVGVTVEAFNFETGQYDAIGSYTPSFLADQVNRFDISDGIGVYVSKSVGEVAVRLTVDQDGPVLFFPWEFSIDRFTWETD